MNITTGTLLQCLGCAIVCIVLLYIIMSLLKYQVKIVEGITNMASDSSNIAESIKKDTTKTLDGMLIDKYRTNYEDIIINMNEWCDIQILNTIISGDLDCTNGYNDKLLSKMRNINDLETFKGTLNKAMKYLDKQ
jgi:hypothetical protein|tara:strand:- start:1105 stop:1509 length:405 start_codon:yes stop_codon:yes gene_type:complete